MERKEVINVGEVLGTDYLAEREQGALLREKVEEIIKEKGVKVWLDFYDVWGITQCFADEFLGVLLRKYGKEWVQKNIGIKFARRKVRSILNWTIKLVLQQEENVSI